MEFAAAAADLESCAGFGVWEQRGGEAFGGNAGERDFAGGSDAGGRGAGGRIQFGARIRQRFGGRVFDGAC